MAEEEGTQDTVVEKKDLLLLSGQLGQEWRNVGRFLDLSDEDIGIIECNYKGNQGEINYQMLLKWKQLKGRDATCDALEVALKNAKRKDLADEVNKVYRGSTIHHGTAGSAEETIPRKNSGTANPTTDDLRGNAGASGYNYVSKENVEDYRGSTIHHGTAVSAEETLPWKNPGTGFGQFAFELAKSFTLKNARKVATLLEFSPADRDQIENDTDPGHAFTQLLREKGVIGQNDISALITAMEGIGLRGVSADVQQSFARHVSAKHTSTKISPKIQAHKRTFIEEIKAAYKVMYDALQPVPYFQDDYVCVNKLFVDSGMEFYDTKGYKDNGIWVGLESYHCLFTDPRLNAVRFVLFGDPGYGKSTIALQYVHDWCNSSPGSPLEGVEMLIFLRLRQLKQVKSFYAAIKHFILSRECKLQEIDIENIILASKSVVIIFDGLDEYLHQLNDDMDDVMAIIRMQMFRSFKVILTTRSSASLPKLPPGTQRLRLKGFDDQARRKYILKAVVNGDREAADAIMEKLSDNPILRDICQVPLFFAMFAHMTHKKETSQSFESVTSFFRYVVSCFYEHMQIRSGFDSKIIQTMMKRDHSKLNNVAFESLKRLTVQLVWRKDDFAGRIGDTLYNDLVQTGILIEEDDLSIIDKPGTSVAEHVQRRRNVSFYHKLFCEWYAAHYVADYVTGPGAGNLPMFFENIDPFDLEYMFRFACGLNPVAADRIIQYLHSIEGGDKFAILCIVEKTGEVDEIIGTIREMCFEGVIISSHDSLLLQRSSMQLLEIAARNEIAIEYVDLRNCLKSVDLSSATIRTTSGLALTSRIPIILLGISLISREMTEDEAIAILEFSSMCPSLRYLWYAGCVPPQVFKKKSTLSTLKSKNVTVSWQWASDEPIYNLNLQTGRWENENDGSEPTVEDFQRMLSKDAEYRKGYTEERYKQDVKNFREVLRKDAEKRRRDAR